MSLITPILNARSILRSPRTPTGQSAEEDYSTVDVVFSGDIIEGFNRSTVKQNFAKYCSLEPAKVDLLFEHKRCIALKVGVNEATARKYQQSLAKIGIQTLLKPKSPKKHKQGPSGQARQQKMLQDKLAFEGDGGEYFKIWAVNVLLTLLTFGVFFPWARVRSLRYFYSHCFLANQSFEYLGNPLSLLKGWVILLVASSGLLLLAQYDTLALVLSALLFILIITYLIYQTLLFSASNSAYCNTRLSFHAPFAAFAAFFWGGIVITLLTAGLLLPFVLSRQQAFVMKHIHYGHYHTKRKWHFKNVNWHGAGLIVWAFSGALLVDMQGWLQREQVAALYASILFTYMIWSIKRATFIFNSVTIGSLKCQSTLPASRLIRQLALNTLFTLLTLGLYLPWAKVSMIKLYCNHVIIDNDEVESFLQACRNQPLNNKNVPFIEREIGLW